MLESGQELNVPLPLTGLTRQLFQTAIPPVMETKISALQSRC